MQKADGGGGRWRKVAMGVGIAFCVAVAVVLPVVQRVRAPAADSREPPRRGELHVRETSDGRWLVHSVADFRLRHPGPSFQRAPELERELRGGEAYAFQDAEDRATLVVVVSKDTTPDDDKHLLQGYLSMTKQGMEKARAEHPELLHRIEVEDITAQPPYIARTWGYHSGSRSATIVRIAHPAGTEDNYFVSVMAMSAHPAELGPVLESLYVPPEQPRGRSLEQQRQQFPQFRKHRTPPRAEPAPQPPPAPPSGIELVQYRGPAGTLSAYLHAPKDRTQRHPAVLWCHGGFGGIDQSQWTFHSDAKGEVGPLFAEKGFVVLSPSWRGESGSDGQPELFWGEVDDALASIDYLAKLDFVDPSRIYVAGHSSGATLALLVGQRQARIRAVFSFGGAFDVGEYAGASFTETFPFDPAHGLAAWLRSPLAGIAETKVPTFHFEGAASSSEVERIAQRAARRAKVPVSTFVLDGLDHWTAVPPMARLVIEKTAADRAGASLEITQQDVDAALAKQ